MRSPRPHRRGWSDGPVPAGSSERQPPWWPEGESWPPRSGPGAQAWSGFGRRLARVAAVWFALVIVVPLVLGVALAATVGGWTSVAIAVASWIGLAVVLSIGVRAAFRFWSPVRSLIETVGRLADGDYTARVQTVRRSPLGQVTDSINRMAERLEQTEAERRRLLADVGHEIRTPLTIVRGELEAMADGVRVLDADELRRLLGDIDVVERLLDDLATLSRAEAGMLTIHREPTEIVGLVRELVDGMQPVAAGGGVALGLTAGEPEVDAEVDPIRFREIVTNLVANGLRATPSGGRVDVAVRRSDTRLVVEIADTGHGIPAEDIDRIFERFHKGPDSGGSGLGLTISRDLARAHDGDVTVTSEPGAGTTVTVDVPTEPGWPDPGGASGRS